MASPTITVVISHYEQQEELRRCLGSVMGQTLLPQRIVVVDDGSAVAPKPSQWPQHPDVDLVLLLSEANSGGPARPRNRGVGICCSSHVAFLDADDAWFPGTLAAMAAIWEREPEVVVYGDQVVWGPGLGQPFLQRALAQPGTPAHTYRQLLARGNQLFLSSVGGPTGLFQQEPFDPALRWEDFDLWLRLARRGCHFRHSGQIHTLYHLQQGSRSGSRQARHQGCSELCQRHFQGQPWWRWPRWYWRQRFL
jgi:GT2 family glycosyltransferase